MIRQDAKPAFIQLLAAMQKQGEQINKDFDHVSGDQANAIAALASQQAAICTILKLVISE